MGREEGGKEKRRGKGGGYNPQDLEPTHAPGEKQATSSFKIQYVISVIVYNAYTSHALQLSGLKVILHDTVNE